jgi:hypothetical protein
VDPARVLEQLDEARRSLCSQGIEHEVLPKLTRIRGSAGDWHAISYSRLDASGVEAAIIEQVRHYRALGVEVEWTVFAHDQPLDLRERLARHGFEIGPMETVVVLDLAEQPAWLDAPSAARVERVTSAAGARALRVLAERIFAHSQELVEAELLRALDAGSSEHIGYIVYEGDVPAGVGRLHTHAQTPLAGLYGGGTLPEYRGRGLYRAGVAARARDARALGARYVRVDALPTSRPILERLGFVRITDTWPCILRVSG